jgi:nitroreductase
MDLLETLRSTGAVREFTDAPVPDETLARVLDTARFAPSGGNAQSWRVVVVRDREVRERLRDLYLRGWYDYLAMARAGLRPFSPLNDRDAERQAVAAAPAVAASSAAAPGFAEHLDRAPVLLALFADLAALAATDRDLDRYPIVGGASVYPFAWSILLAARAEGLGGVITTMATRAEPDVQALLGAPDQFVLAAVVALGHPVSPARRLRRAPVQEFTTIDRIDGPAFDPRH